MQIHMRYKIQLGAFFFFFNSLWHEFQLQSGYKVGGVTWSNMSNWTVHQ